MTKQSVCNAVISTGTGDTSLILGWLVGFVQRPIDSEVIWRWRPHLLSLAKDVNLGFCTDPTVNQTPGCCVAVNYATAMPRQLLTSYLDF